MASAEEDLSYNGVATVTIPTNAQAGSAITVGLSGFGANETVKIWLQSDPVVLSAGVATDASGAASTTVTIPASTTPGSHSILAIGQSSRRGDKAAITILPADADIDDDGDGDDDGNPDSNTGLPNSGGNDPWLWIALAGVLVVSGGLVYRRVAVR
ncbi:MAG: hypothetical protein LBR58_08380 [Propionibacteriaceae bacterium]|jgi:hypothetical protein|nr:hypothetical protein [Propionibacteriaceae bacterium]